MSTLEKIATDYHERTGWTGRKLELAVMLYGLMAAAGQNNTAATNHFIARADSLGN